MLENYFVSRKDYNHDVFALRDKVAELNKQLREQEQQKAEAKQSTKLAQVEGDMLRNEIVQLQKKLANKVGERDLQEYMSPIPEGETERAAYMSEVALIFHSGLREKLNYMHLQFRNQTGMFPITERETDFFRSCINVVGLLLDWGEESVAEHNSNIASANDKDESSVFEEEEKVENIKRIVKDN